MTRIALQPEGLTPAGSHAQSSCAFKLLRRLIIPFLFAAAGVASADNPQNARAFNVYDTDSLQPLIEWGVALQEEGRHAEAVEHFKQARQASRIKNGLYDETQIILSEAIIESEVALQNWREVDDHYRHLEHLYHKLYDMEDPQLEAGLQKVSGWLTFSLSTKPTGDRIEQLYRASRIYKLRLQIARQTLDEDHPKVAFLQENIAICEKQLYPMPSHGRADSRKQRRGGLSRNPVLATLD